MKMKEAMWAVDPMGGARYRDSTVRDQMVLFEAEPDFTVCCQAMRSHFGGTPFSIEQAEEFTSSRRHTSAAPEAEDAGGGREGRTLSVKRPQALEGTYIAGTVIRFV